MKEFKSFYKSVGGNEGGKCKYCVPDPGGKVFCWIDDAEITDVSDECDCFERKDENDNG